MEIVIGNSQTATTIDTEERRIAIAPDKGDKLVILLGINRVEIEHVDGSWTITHGANVVIRVISQSDPKTFWPVDEKIKNLLV